MIHAIIIELSKKFIWSKYKDLGFENYKSTIDNYQIQYWDTKSDKKPLLLIHGFGASAEFQWYKQIKDLSKNHRVIIPNLFYFGESKPLKNDLYSLQDQVDLIKTLIKQLEINQFILAGVSYGGLISIEYTNQNPNDIEKLILIDAPIKYFNKEDIATICSIYKVASIYDFFTPSDYRGLKKQLASTYYARQFIPDFLIKIYYNYLCKPNLYHWSKLIQQLLADMDHYTKTEYKIDCKTLLIWGKEDDVIPPRIGKQLQMDLKNSRLVLFEKAKHLPNLEHPTKFNNTIVDFLKE